MTSKNSKEGIRKILSKLLNDAPKGFFDGIIMSSGFRTQVDQKLIILGQSTNIPPPYTYNGNRHIWNESIQKYKVFNFYEIPSSIWECDKLTPENNKEYEENYKNLIKSLEK